MKEEKPMIRHCKNCKWNQVLFGKTISLCYCKVKFRNVNRPRIMALICSYFSMKEREND